MQKARSGYSFTSMFDRKAFDLIAAGDRDLGRQVADLFRDDCLHLLEEMEAALLRADDAAVRRVGHTLKSTCLTVGAIGASRIGKRIEDGGITVIRERLHELEPLLAEVFLWLDEIADTLQPS